MRLDGWYIHQTSLSGCNSAKHWTLIRLLGGQYPGSDQEMGYLIGQWNLKVLFDPWKRKSVFLQKISHIPQICSQGDFTLSQWKRSDKLLCLFLWLWPITVYKHQSLMTVDDYWYNFIFSEILCMYVTKTDRSDSYLSVVLLYQKRVEENRWKQYTGTDINEADTCLMQYAFDEVQNRESIKYGCHVCVFRREVTLSHNKYWTISEPSEFLLTRRWNMIETWFSSPLNPHVINYHRTYHTKYHLSH